MASSEATGAHIPDQADGADRPAHLRQVAPERRVFRGRVFEIVELDVEEQGHPKTFERARRAPGTRIIVRDDAGRVLLTREWRYELGRFDLRLPGGKVFDTLDEYERHRRAGESVQSCAAAAALRELHEEAGLVADTVEPVHRSVCGATVDWDLYYFQAIGWRPAEDGTHLEPGEDIEVTWLSPQDTVAACLSGVISEERSALVLLRMLLHDQ